MKAVALFTAIAMTVMTGSAFAATYEIDPMHTNARFAIDHFKTSTNVGGFYGLGGELEYDKTTGKGKIDIDIPMANLQTGSDKFTNHLKSADIFNAETHPKINFTSTKFNYIGKGKTRKLSSVDGTLTMMGQTHPVRLRADKFNCYQSPMLKKEVCGGDFSTVIDRTKWGVDYLVDSGMTKKVRLDIQIEAAIKE